MDKETSISHQQVLQMGKVVQCLQLQVLELQLKLSVGLGLEELECQKLIQEARNNLIEAQGKQQQLSELVKTSWNLWYHLQAILEITVLDTKVHSLENKMGATKKYLSTLPLMERKEAMQQISTLMK